MDCFTVSLSVGKYSVTEKQFLDICTKHSFTAKIHLTYNIDK